MIAIPTINVRAGHCVAGTRGARPAAEQAVPDPAAVAREYGRFGFARLQIVDVDAATGPGSNRSILRESIRDADIDVQAGGGLSTADAIRDLLEDGARWAVVGRQAVRDPDWLAEVASAYPHEVIMAADVRDRRIVAPGARHFRAPDVFDFIAELADVPLAGILVTSMRHAGRLEGPDLQLVADAVEATDLPVLAAGGIATIGQLRHLEDRGAAGAVIGTAFLAGVLNPVMVAGEFPA